MGPYVTARSLQPSAAGSARRDVVRKAYSDKGLVGRIETCSD
jgi:hypothetical protein